MVLTCVDYVGYIVKFPGADDEDASMALSFDCLSIGSPRSTKRSPDHFHSLHNNTPYKRQCVSNLPATLTLPELENSQSPPKSKSLPQTESARTVRAQVMDAVVLNATPWGKLVSKTTGIPDISLDKGTTLIGEACDVIDIDSGQRKLDYSIISLSAYSNRGQVIAFFGCRMATSEFVISNP